MQTSSTAPSRENQIFARESHGKTLVINPLIHLGSLHEPEIVHETEDLLDFLKQSSSTNLLIDLAQGNYLGTAMLGAMVKLWKRVSQHGGQLALCNVSEGVLMVLRATKLQTVWPIYGTREEAIAALGDRIAGQAANCP
jgi:anti-sigma B factor antagonist